MSRGTCCAPWVARGRVFCWFLCIWAAAALPVRAGEVSLRGQVAADLGPALMEDFEKFPAGDGTNYAFGQEIDGCTVTQHAGPGLVNNGLTFSATGTSFLTWNGVGANGQASRDLGLFVFSGDSATVGFAKPTPAVGMELIGSGAVGAPPEQMLRMRVLGPDDATVLDTVDLALAPGTPVFFGYVAGDREPWVGSVVMENPTATWQVVAMDNVVYGTAVPLPSGWWGGVMGVVVVAGSTLTRRRGALTPADRVSVVR